MTTAKNVIVGTAGHIDHGKSSLVEALTGTHPDRLEEEKRRGITIDLGFAFLEEDGMRFGFVDVPGHERFVSNMLAGAAGIDLVILVIAADESIKPQTREHLDICRLLGVSRGVVALTKSDLVDGDDLALVRLETEELLKHSFLEQAAILPVSVKTAAGLADLKAELRRLANEIPGKDSAGYFRLPIDRSFSMKGFGTVVTGTLVSGSLGSGDEVELFPVGQRLRVRGIHSAGKNVERAFAGQRTAVNLAGIEHTSVARGMALAAPGRFRSTNRVDVHLQLLPGARKVKHRGQVHFHSGSAETIAEVFLHQHKELGPGEKALAHFRLKERLLLLSGDRFIVREFSPVSTIGGGVVLDPLARRPMARDTTRPAFLKTLEEGNHEETLAAMTERAPYGLSFAEITARTAWTDRELADAYNKLLESGRVKRIAAERPFLLERKRFDAMRLKLVENVEKFHKNNPLSPGLPREQLRTSLGKRTNFDAFRAAVEELASEGKLELAGELVRKPGASIALQPEEARSRDQIEAVFKSAGLAVPPVKEVLAGLLVDSKRAEKLLQLLLREKSLIRVTPDLIFHQRALQEMRSRLVDYKKTRGERISVPVFKELTGISRKYAIPLLEYLDRERVTRRVGDERVIL